MANEEEEAKKRKPTRAQLVKKIALFKSRAEELEEESEEKVQKAHKKIKETLTK